MSAPVTEEQRPGGRAAGPRRPEPNRVWAMFDRIAPRYDTLNRLLSLRRDVAWRRRVGRHLPAGRPLRLLDLATGTADQLLALCEAGIPVEEGVGLDMAERMLERGRLKIEERGLQHLLTLSRGDATNLPFPVGRFDVVTMSFGIRNVQDVPAALSEMLRVLRPGGLSLVLEFSLPSSRLLRGPYLFYFRHVLPRVGGWVSGDRSAYRYLNETVETFPSGPAFVRLLEEAGFARVVTEALTFGVATIYRAEKAAEGGRP